jgi:hypothetical protein
MAVDVQGVYVGLRVWFGIGGLVGHEVWLWVSVTFFGEGVGSVVFCWAGFVAELLVVFTVLDELSLPVESVASPIRFAYSGWVSFRLIYRISEARFANCNEI